MEPITKTTSLWDILKDSRIVIPTFQRDYAQGRAGKEELRKKFLKQIHTALKDRKELLLDFVYGTKIDGVIYPLDGQQRLTTIWTLMWYATLKGQNENTSKEHLERLRKFTYETRESSRDFMTWLCDENTISYLRSENNSTENEIRLLSDSIQMHSGFNLGWNQDPTVQSILRMLSGTYTKKKQNKKEEIIPNNDGIEQVFKKEDYDCLEKLFEESLVKFYHLDLVGIKQPDNLYVKMNARGEQLTGFENFKADLIEEFLKDKDKDNDNDLKKYVTPGYEEYILTKWDINWTNIFWQQLKQKEQNSVDDMFFTFIKRFLLNRYNANYTTDNNNKENKDNKRKDKIYTLLFENEQEEYTSYNHYKELINNDCIDELTILLDNIASCNRIDEFKKLIFEGEIPLLSTKKYAFLPQYEKSDKEKSDSSIKSYSFQERVVMYGICLYLQHAKIDNNIDCFKHWLRVLSNLAYYKELPTYSSYRTRLKFIKELVDKLKSNDGFLDIYSDNAVENLKSLSNSNDGDDEVNDNKKQLQEEIRKIGKINDDKNENAEKILEKLESLWIFSGNIDCLLDDDLFNNDKIYETISGYIGENPTTFLRDNDKLISLFQAILAKTEKDVDVMKFNDEHDGLRKLLNGALKVQFQNVLKDNQTIEGIIKSYNNKDDWKYALIKDKRLWNYAAKGILKKEEEGKHYLYKGTYKNDADILLEGYNAFICKSNNNIEQSAEIEFKDKKWYIDNQVIENWEKYLNQSVIQHTNDSEITVQSTKQTLTANTLINN